MEHDPRRPRLTYANVVATCALVMSLGGGAYAASTLPARSVGQRQLQPGAVAPGALGFPLGAKVVTATTRTMLSAANCPVGADGIAPPCVPAPSRPLATITVNTRHTGTVVVSALAHALNST